MMIPFSKQNKLALLCIGMVAACPAARASLVSDSTFFQWHDSTRLALRFPLSAGDVPVKSDYRLVVTPCLVGADGQTIELNPVEFAGKRNRRANDRAAFLAGGTTARTGVYDADATMTYEASVSVEPWMRRGDVQLVLRREKDGCCETEQLAALPVAATRYVPPFIPVPKPVEPHLSLAEEIAVREPVLRPISEYKPYNPSVPLRKMKGALFVHFPVGKSVLRRDFRDNAATLDKIVDMMRRIQKDPTSDVVKVVIVGLASPEGGVALNNRLAGNRARALRDYVAQRVSMPDSVYEVVNGGEAWADLRDVIAESSLPERDAMLEIIDHTADPALRERKLMRLKGGRPFAYLKQSVFADQRNSGYIRVYYEAVPDQGAEAINRAVQLIREKRYEEALRVVEAVKDDERSLNTLGVAYYMLGRKSEAVKCFEQAAQAGNEDARRNLEEMK